MADDSKIDRRDTSYVLTTPRSDCGYGAARSNPRKVVWVDQDRYVRLKGSSRAGCQVVEKAGSEKQAGFYRLDMNDRFELVRLEVSGGKQREVVSDLSGPEAFAYLMTLNRTSESPYSIQKVTLVHPKAPQCLEKKTGWWDASDRYLDRALLGDEVPRDIYGISHDQWNGLTTRIADPDTRGRTRKAVAEALRAAQYSGVEAVIDADTADLLRRTIDRTVSEYEPHYGQALETLREIGGDLINLAVEADVIEGTLAAPRLKDSLSKTIPPGKFTEHVKYLVNLGGRIGERRPSLIPETTELTRRASDLREEEMRPWFEDYLHALDARAVLASQSQGPIHLTSCAQERPYRSIEDPADNPWIEGEEVVDLAHVIYEVVLPAIPDPKERETVRSQFEAALQQAGDTIDAPLGRIEAAAANTIRRIVAAALSARPQGEKDTQLSRVARNLRAQPAGPITLMAAGALFQRGGYLPQIDSVALDLPTRTLRQGGVELDIAALARAGGQRELTRDWALVLSQWQLEKRFDSVSQKASPKARSGSIPFGNHNVPLFATRGVAEAEQVESWREILQRGLSFITRHKDFGERYLTELARRGVREIVIVPQSHLDTLLHQEGVELARRGRDLFAKNPEAAIRLLQAAAAKFSYRAAGMYLGKTGQILLSAEALQGQNPAATMELFLHELAHADEKVRRDAGILSPGQLTKIDRAQARSLASDPQTVSDHPEVLSRSPSATGEWRADGLMTYWTKPKRLRDIDPILHDYFVALTRVHHEKEVTLTTPRTRDENGRPGKVTRKVAAERWQTPKNPFDPRLGLFAEQAPFNEDWLDCLLRAGDNDQWSPKPWERGCRLVND